MGASIQYSHSPESSTSTSETVRVQSGELGLGESTYCSLSSHEVEGRKGVWGRMGAGELRMDKTVS